MTIRSNACDKCSGDLNLEYDLDTGPEWVCIQCGNHQEFKMEEKTESVKVKKPYGGNRGAKSRIRDENIRQHKDEVISDYSLMKSRDFFQKWGLQSRGWKPFKDEWGIKSKQRGPGVKSDLQKFILWGDTYCEQGTP